MWWKFQSRSFGTSQSLCCFVTVLISYCVFQSTALCQAFRVTAVLCHSTPLLWWVSLYYFIWSVPLHLHTDPLPPLPLSSVVFSDYVMAAILVFQSNEALDMSVSQTNPVDWNSFVTSKATLVKTLYTWFCPPPESFIIVFFFAFLFFAWP